MRVAFVNFTGLRPTGSWPETAASMVNGLRQLGHDVTVIEPAVSLPTLHLHARKAMYRMIGLHFHTERQRSVAIELARSVERQLALMTPPPDVVLSSSSLPMAFLGTDIPKAFWTDATFASMVGFYREFSSLSKETRRSGMELEDQALARCEHAFYSSEWAARSAIDDHRGDPSKVHVVPFGPNLAEVPSTEEVLHNIAHRERDKCRLLFIGYDWERKQGDMVLRVQEAMERQGIRTELTIIGTAPGLSQRTGVQVLGRLDKHVPTDRVRLVRYLNSSHFLIVPSLAECYGMVYAEASAHGLPSVACDVGGVATVVHDGRNGLLFPSSASAEEMAMRIGRVWADKDAYDTLARSSRGEFDGRLNWANSIGEIMARVGKGTVKVSY